MSNHGSRVAIAMSDALTRRLFSAESLQRANWLGATALAPGDVHAPVTFDVIGSATEVIITGWDTPVLHEQIEQASRLSLIAHTGGSIRHIVPKSVYDRGIAVTTVAGVLADAVAEFTVMSMIAGLRRVRDFDRRMRARESWDDMAQLPPGSLLREQTVGLIGASRVGRAVIPLLTAFGCRIIVADPYLSDKDARALGVERVTLENLLHQASVLSVHAPVLPSTVGMIGARELSLMPDGALLINTARAALIDSDALYRELASGRLRGSLDVFDEEPLSVDSRWRDIPGCDVSPHIAALTAETLHAQGRTVLDEIERHRAGAPLIGAVSREAFDLIA